MATPAEVFVIGLCSFVNISNNPSSDLPRPSVICHRADTVMNHVAYLAYEPAKVTLQDETSFNPTDLGNGFKYIVLDGERLTLNDNWSADPVPQASFTDGVPNIAKYGRVATVVFNHDRVPKRGMVPKKKEAAVFMELGGDSLWADEETDVPYRFVDKKKDVSLGPKRFMRRVRHGYNALSDSIVILADPFGGGTRRKFVFTKNGGPLEVWLGNSMPGFIKSDLKFTTVTPSTGIHFKFFYRSLANPLATIHLPEAHKGAGTGYCGPDSQP